MCMPELVYCAGGNAPYADVAIAAGYRYGSQLPKTVYAPLWFADQNWRRPNRAQYMHLLEKYRPHMATVLDLEQPSQLKEVLNWAEEAAPYVQKIVIIPKFSGAIDVLPRTIGGASIVLGYSVPTAYGGTEVPVWEFQGWPVHLLGGSPHKQMLLSHYLYVVSVDGNMMNKMSHKGMFWSQNKGPKGHWRKLQDINIDLPTNNNLAAFSLSCVNIMRAWKALYLSPFAGEPPYQLADGGDGPTIGSPEVL